MKFNVQVKESSEGNVWKYVFTDEKTVIEAVLYKYNSFEERTVICCSVQSGCPVGCSFCGTGKRFIRNLSSTEIADQIEYILKDKNINVAKVNKFQIMFMSMGEPFLNYGEVSKAIRFLHKEYDNAQLLVSTMGVSNFVDYLDFCKLSIEIDKVGLQFSIHEAFMCDRDKLIPYKNKMTLDQIQAYGSMWSSFTGRPTYLNYCVHDKNSSSTHAIRLMEQFPDVDKFFFTFSVICEKDENMKSKSKESLPMINNFTRPFLEAGYNTRVFNPAGQDDIGGGRGQLHFVQKYLKEIKCHKK